MLMESPERLSFCATLEGQESPLFNFLCTLSPIKPIKSLHASQSFTELSFPPPPAVFVTPRVHGKSSLCRSSYKSEQTVLPSHSNSIQNDDREDIPCVGQRITQNQDISAGLLCTSSSQFVEPQLVEHMEAESSATCSTVLTPACVSNGHSHSPVDVLIARDSDQCNSLGVEGTIAPPNMLYKVLESDNKEEHMASLVGNSETFQGNRPLEPLNVVCSRSYGTVDDKEALGIDEEAAELMLLLSEVADKTAPLHENVEGWQKATSSSLSAMPNQHMSSFPPSFYGNGKEKAQDGQLDSFLMQMSTDCGDRKSANVYKEQQEGAANKVNFPVQRGFRRRCLDFRASDSHWNGKGTASLKSMQSNVYSRSQSTSTYPSDHQDIHVTVLKERILATSDAINSDSMPVNAKASKQRLSQSHLLKDAPADRDGQPHETCPPCGTSPSPPNIPSGIGLHLNSLTGSMLLLQSSRGVDSFSASVKFSSAVVSAKSQSRIQLADKHGISSPPANLETSMQSGASFEGDPAVSVVEKPEIMACKDDVMSASESVACVGSFTTTKQLKEYVSSARLEQLPTHLDQERVLLPVGHCQIDFDGGQDGSTIQTGKNTRKRASTTDMSGDGCKRCNCKKSKCLKLYCECFAAGVFCIDSCSCHDCHNKPSFEDMVLETRQQIESRNPLAFAPKITRAVAKSPMIGEETIDVTPASARHKKGCSCKKSKCLKKYCECYQAGVGCSHGCRCDNCENLYGRKEGLEGSEGKDVGEGLKEKGVTKEKMDTSDFCSEYEHVAPYRHSDLSPITPSFQYAGPISSSTIYRSSTRRRFSNKGLQSPDSLPPSSKPPKTALQPPRSSKAEKNSFEMYKIGRQLPSSPGHSLRSGQFSPRWDGLGDICTLTPLPQAPHHPATPSASLVYGADSSSSLNVPQCGGPPSSGSDSVCNVNLAQCSSPACHQVSDSSTTNYRVHTPTDLQSSPTTPIVNAPFCGMGLESPYEGSMLFYTKSGGSSEDAIPAILKGSEPAHSSIFSLKSNSPKQKRVSPPHFIGSRITSQGRGQSPALRNGRKFMLQSVSLVPTTTYSSI